MCAKEEIIPTTGNKFRLLKARRILLALMVVGFVASATGLAVAQEKSTRAQKNADVSYPEAVEAAARNVPPPGEASMYVLRPSSIVGSAGCFSLEVDHSTWGGLGNGQFSWAPLSPGEHFFKRTVKGEVSLNAEPGKTYYMVLTPGGLGTGGVRFVSAEEGAKMKSKLSLNPDQWLLREFLANWHSVRIGMTLNEVQHLVHLSEGSRYLEEGPRLQQMGTSGLVAILGTKTVFRFNSMLGYSLTFEDETLTEKQDHQQVRVDGHGCPSPASAK
jgi:hypothetical protein